MRSIRFDRSIVVTHHARQRMAERSISEILLVEIIDTGDIRYADASRAWVFKSFPNRNDNLLCAVLVLEDAVIVKTVMHHFELR